MPLQKEGNAATDMQTHTCEDGGRNWSDKSIRSRIAGNFQKLGERHERESFPELSEGLWPANNLILNF